MSTIKQYWEMSIEEKMQDFVSGLRALADHLEFVDVTKLSPDFYPTLRINTFPKDVKTFKQQVQQLKKAGKLEKKFDNVYAEVKKNFSSSVSFEINLAREQVCEKIVKEVKVIPAYTYTVPERTEEVIEWKCKDKIFMK